MSGSRATAPGRTKLQYILRLYVTGTTPISRRAIMNLKAICNEHLAGRYQLEVVDIYQNPVLTNDDKIVAAPTLVKSRPHPLRRIIGDLSDHERVLLELDVKPKK